MNKPYAVCYHTAMVEDGVYAEIMPILGRIDKADELFPWLTDGNGDSIAAIAESTIPIIWETLKTLTEVCDQ